MSGRAVALLLAVALAGCGGGDSAEEEKASPVVQALKEGGHTLVIRHATADANINRQELLRSCAYQRNLTQAGRDQARQIGEGIRQLDVPIGEVNASPLCRGRDTARLAFGRVTIDRTLISPGVIGTEADDRERAARLKRLVDRPPPPSEGNRVLVTHTGNIGSALGEETVQEGETLVYARDARLVGRVKAEEWAQLATGGGG